eukprot:CAMPEP_0174750136 /NCGR_PEP_ID=MMETSP1094-20130205/97103_1 /TAXON_ID=156173 /ORGANISM="Chrysochromulina brevifilum, Strain UTEX LB 985" /LENGTH=226 /DNA_ID=CAMNT_0015955443 /DNA_START=54 /DNA_END=734 /DNA_ORIENTATION=-
MEDRSGDSSIATVGHADICQQLESILVSKAPRTWCVEVSASQLTGAGEGVFLRGSCAAGSVLALYPGVVFATSDLPAMHKMILPGNEYVLMRRDGLLIDGRPDGPSRQLYEVARQRDRAAGCEPFVEGGELTVGNKVNHPPKGRLPNVFVQPFDLRPGEHQALHPYLPVVNFRPPAAGEPCKSTAVLVASRDLSDGEELFLNYKLRPEGPLASWYSPVQRRVPLDE